MNYLPALRCEEDQYREK
jgi:hypothetical protein